MDQCIEHHLGGWLAMLQQKIAASRGGQVEAEKDSGPLEGAPGIPKG